MFLGFLKLVTLPVFQLVSSALWALSVCEKKSVLSLGELIQRQARVFI